MPDLEDLLARFDAAALHATIYESNEDDFYHRGLTVTVPRGESFQRVLIGDGDVEAVGDAPIEHYAFVEGYDAIWSLAFRRVECRLTLGRRWMTWDLALHHHRASQTGDAASPPAGSGLPTISLASPDPSLTVTIQPASRPHQLLCGQRIGGTRLVMSAAGQSIEPTLILSGAMVTDHDSALRILDSVAGSLLFDLDRAFDVPIYLTPDPGDIHLDFAAITLATSRVRPPTPRRIAYAAEALAIYWAARSLDGNPLQQYLAYYQVLEYFFPHFALRQAIDAAHSVMAPEAFSASRRDDMKALVEAVQWPKDELQSLQLVLERAVGEARMLDFFAARPSRGEYFSSTSAQRPTRRTITATMRGQGICRQVAQRVYSLRCRIVHTKASGSKEPPLLPHAPEVRELRLDLELVEFVACEVLVSTSSPLVVTSSTS